MENISKKWVEEDKRIFSVYPGTPKTGSSIPGEEETWLVLARFFRDDLQWLLSLEHHKFWSHMIYSDKVHPLLVSFLKECPPNHLVNYFFVTEEMQNTFREIEHLVFLIFLRLSTEEESKSCFIKNLGEILYNNYLFTVPIVLDICLIYGTSNSELVKNMINNVVRLAPDFLNDFQEIMPHFFQVLNILRGKFSVEHVPKLKDKVELQLSEIRDLALYLHDSAATIQLFLELYPKACNMFSKSELISEIVSFYSNDLPKVHSSWERRKDGESFPLSELIEDTRMDLLKIVKCVLDFVSGESTEILQAREEAVEEYLTLMMELLSEPLFVVDFNLMYSIEYEIGAVTRTCANVDTMKVDHILNGLALAAREMQTDQEKFSHDLLDVREAELESLVTEVKDILPHLKDEFIRERLRCYDYNTERVVAAVLENPPPEAASKDAGPEAGAAAQEMEAEGPIEFRGKHKSKHRNLNELLDDRGEIRELRERYSQLAYLPDDTYDDEYDDTYDENIDVAVRDAEEAGRRPFVVPRVLRTEEENEEDGEEEEEEEEEKPEQADEHGKRDLFVENPAERRERMAQRRAEHPSRNVAGRGRGRGQSREVLRNREFKGAHKSSMANHNRKAQASRKMNRGMLHS